MEHGWGIAVPKSMMPKMPHGSVRMWHPPLEWLTATQRAADPHEDYHAALRATELQMGITLIPGGHDLKRSRRDDGAWYSGGDNGAWHSGGGNTWGYDEWRGHGQWSTSSSSGGGGNGGQWRDWRRSNTWGDDEWRNGY